MKLMKSTTILLNIVLILVVALLVKSLIATPKNLYAKGKIEYKVSNLEYELIKIRDEFGREKFNKMFERLDTLENESLRNELVINSCAKEGWKLHSYVWSTGTGRILLIFER